VNVDLAADMTATVFVATRTVVEPAVLGVQMTGGTAMISWPDSLTGYLLERAVEPGGDCTPVTISPATAEDTP
jgi:hypothetical protein